MKPKEFECPLCTKDNECAVVSGQKVSDCWCHQQSFPEPSGFAHLSISKHQCLCQSCIKQMNKIKGNNNKIEEKASK